MDLKAYHELINDAWRFFRKYAEMIPLPDNQWTTEVTEKLAFVEQHTGCRRLALKLMTAIEDELEHLDREAKRSN